MIGAQEKVLEDSPELEQRGAGIIIQFFRDTA
jgi:hypothetical protein